ncbi:MAG TPA: plastocyanin/azurin family copper-binding protein, partial [Verrucomicrobiae bacterium]|nr:plastocyanin/azurin family copper-binding protein [Verrucomicrobiae bacterium]
MKTSSLRIAVLAAIIAPFLVFHPTIARAATVTVMVGPGGFFFKPSSVTIHPGDTVVWTWSSSDHSSTSGSPGMPSGLWDSGILNQGANFMHTFPTAGSFPYFCTPHGACCGMVGAVTVSNPTPTPSPTPASSLGNISTRGLVQTGGDVMIGGFIVQGTQSKTLIMRAIGPELIPFGIANALADPFLELHNGAGTLIAINNNWQTTLVGGIITGDQVSQIQASGHAPTQPSESAIIATLPPGNYTAIVRGVNNTTGV